MSTEIVLILSELLPLRLIHPYSLPVGQTVRIKHDNDWRKAEVARVLQHRSYEVRLEDGTTRRCTSRHVRFSSEPPIVLRKKRQ